MSDSAANHNEESFEFDCPECGTHIEGEVDRCPRCGVEFVIEEVSEAECPRCHAIIPVESVKCPNCGLGFDAPSEAGEPAPMVEEAPVAEAAPEVQEVRPQVEARPEIAPEVPVEEARPEAPAEPAPAEASVEPVVTQDRLKEEFSGLVGQVKPLFALAKDYNIDATEAHRLIDKAVEIGKNKNVEGAVRTLKECLAELDRTIGGHLDKEIGSLDGLAEVVARTGGDPDPISAAADSARAKRAEGDIVGALAKIRAGKKFAEQLAGPFVAAHELYEALDKLVRTAEAFFLDVREVRKLLSESKEAGNLGDWNTMAALARKGREEVVRALPELLRSEMHDAKQALMGSKLRGKDVSAGVKTLKDASAAIKRQHYEEALYLLARFKAGQKA